MKRLLAIAVLVGACGGTTQHGSPTPDLTGSPAPTPSPIYDHVEDVPIGQCFDPIRDSDDSVILAARLKSCDEAHVAEVISQIQLPDAAEAPFPGDAQVDAAATTECGAAFADYVGIEYDLSRLIIEFMRPGADTWPGGDRSVVCIVYGQESEPFTRSVKGSRQ